MSTLNGLGNDTNAVGAENNSVFITDIEHDQNHTKHVNHHPHKIAKRIALISSSIAALASGTPYLYGVYSPQLINRCGFSAIDSSYLSFSGNIGSSIGGFFAGLIIDKFGISAGILLGALLEFTGFFTFYLNYKYALHNFIQLLFAMVCIGFGSVLAYFATIKVATLNFPNHRGFANACPVSSYGLAALFYAFVSTVWFSDDVEGLLKFIALFSGIVIAVSSLFIKIYEKEYEEEEEDDDNDYNHENNQEEINGNHITVATEGTGENEFEAGIEYLLKGHRGSFAQLGNLLRNNSSSSLFSDMTEVSSVISTTPSRTSLSNNLSHPSSLASSRNSSFTSSQHPISISINNQQNLLRSNSSTAFNNLSASPMELKSKQAPLLRSGSFRVASSLSNSPRNGRLFGSVNQKQQQQLYALNNNKLTPTEESALLGNSGITTTSHGNINTTTTTTTNTANNSLINSIPSSPNTTALAYSTKSSPDLKSMKQHPSNTNIHALNVQYPENQDINNVTYTNNTPNYNTINNTTDFSSDSKNSNSSFTNINDLINKSKTKRRKHKKNLTPKEHVLQLLKNKLFLSQYALNAFYCAIGQVYIFSIGFIVRAQVNYYRLHQPSQAAIPSLVFKVALSLTPDSTATSTSDPLNLAVTYQALQVSIISFSNFLGRLVSGPASDLIHKKLKLNKIYVIVFSLFFLTMGQVSLLISNNLDYLSLTSFLIGLSYGSIYGTMPSIVADLFGSKNFATTWALLGTGPIGIFLVLSDYFGVVYDSKSEWSYLGDQKLKMCLKGKNCYWDVFALNTMGCLVLFVGYFLFLYSQNKNKK